jgi:hypothetical protein
MTVLLFTLGTVLGVFITLGTELTRKRNKDGFEKSILELQVTLKQLDQKYLDLYVEVEQMRTILKNNGFEKDVDMPSILRTLSEKVEVVKSNQDFDRKAQAKAIGSVIDDMVRVKRYMTRVVEGNEY